MMFTMKIKTSLKLEEPKLVHYRTVECSSLLRQTHKKPAIEDIMPALEKWITNFKNNASSMRPFITATVIMLWFLLLLVFVVTAVTLVYVIGQKAKGQLQFPKRNP